MENITKILSAMLTPVIAVVTTYIAVQQYRIAKYKSRHELYEPRMKVYRVVRDFILYVLTRGSASDEQLRILIRETSEGLFLFKGRIKNHIDTLYKKGIDIQEISRELNDENLPVGERRTYLAKKKQELFGWFRDQLDESNRLFSKYLTIDS